MMQVEQKQLLLMIPYLLNIIKMSGESEFFAEKILVEIHLKENGLGTIQ